MRRASLSAGLALVPLGWIAAGFGLGAGSWLGAGLGMIGHMIGHMIAVAVAAPLIAFGVAGSRLDPARWSLVTPMAMMLVELCVVWIWHLPAARAAADSSAAAMAGEQAMFLAAGVLLWSAVLGAGRADRRASGVGALLLTSMHMTLLGALIALAPRTLYGGHAHHGLDPLGDQQLGGVVMLLIGAASYLVGGLAMLGGLLRTGEARA